MAKETKAEMKAEVILENAIEGKDVAVENKIETSDKIGEKPQETKEERLGIAYIFSSQNNTIVHITDLAGNTLSRISGGMVTKHSRLKSDPTIAMFVAKRASERPKDLGITGLYVRMRAKTGAEGMGPGSHAVVKALDKQGFKIMGVLDSTRIPRGGPKKKGGKRGRRV
ncbi:MAG: 30S ribosomal protein S11 [Nanoarchaeota archaeon]